MRTPITYYGGKQQMLPELLRIIPKHEIYIEPFFGGGALFWAKQPSFLEVINDINDSVVNFYEVLKTDFDALWRLVDSSLFAESLHRKAKEFLRNPATYSSVQRAWAFWFLANFSFSSKLYGGMKFDNGTTGSHSGTRISNKKSEFVKCYADRLEHVQIQCRDAISVINCRNTPSSLVYADPPYPGSNQGHYKGYKLNDLMDLCETLAVFKGKFILSNYQIPELIEFSEKKGWIVELHDKRLSALNASNKRKVEVLIRNYTLEPTLF